MIVKNVDALNDLKLERVSLVIGNFDGVHRGHQSLLKKFMTSSRSKRVIPVIMTFNPHPAIYLKKVSPKYLIQTSQKKYESLLKLGFKYILEISFDDKVQTLPPERFIHEYILKINQLKYIQLGHDFALGAGKIDAIKALEKAVSSHSIEFEMFSPYLEDEKIVSSSRVRKLLVDGDILNANILLGNKYSVSGFVRRGLGIGKKELVPTANLEPEKETLVPAYGVYFTVTTIGKKKYPSITNVGKKPSIDRKTSEGFETHILDYSSDLYDQNITVEFLKKIRGEKKFSTLEKLKEQIDRDIKLRREYLD